MESALGKRQWGRLLLVVACTLQKGNASTMRLLPALCDGCLQEPLEVDYFGGVFGGEPQRLTNPDRAAFEQAARSGHVLIIENASVDTAMGGWSCARLAEEFPEARMRREYDWATNPEDKNLQKLGDAAWIHKTESGEDGKDRLSQDPDSPPFAPFYWGVREHRQGDIGTTKDVERIRSLIAASVPSFMDPHNGRSMFDNAEFWLGAKGTGARAHMDSHCIPTLSVVLSGERRWRIGPVPRMPRGAGRSRDDEVVFDDGVAYKLGWKPMYEFTVRAGEAVLFPPGWIHETLNTAEGCTVALTTQFDLPRPARYYRNYYSRLRRIGDLYPCWGDMVKWGSGGDPKKKPPSKPDEARAHAESIFERKNSTMSPTELDFFDIDGNGRLTKEEFIETFTSWAATELAVRREKQTRLPKLKPDMSLKASSAVSETGKSGEL